MSNKEYQCKQDYWDKVAMNQADTKQGISEKYTQDQCLAAFRLGLRYAKGKNLFLLKTDLWTEGVIRSREVLNHAIYLAWQKGYQARAYGIDISPIICTKAINNLTLAEVKQGDIRHLEYPGGFFDMILDVSTIDHMAFSEACIALSEYKRCLAHDGVLVLMFAHDRGAIDRSHDPEKLKDYFPFLIEDIKQQLSDFKIKGEYAVHYLNVLPAGHALELGKICHLASLVVKLFKLFEYSFLSKYAKGIAPLYVIIAVEK
jgi:SAM-dependent methyltransferase